MSNRVMARVPAVDLLHGYRPMKPPVLSGREFAPGIGRTGKAIVALLLLLTTLSLSGCFPWEGPLADTSITRQGRDIVFAVSRPSGKPACIGTLSVTDTTHRFIKLWSVGTDPNGSCTSRIVYGRVPPGGDQEGPPRPLAAGQGYVVDITGDHLTAGDRFIAADRQGDLVDRSTS